MRPNLHHLLTHVDSLASAAQRGLRRTLSREEGVRIAAYRGWVTPDKAVVLGRAILADLGLERRLEHSPRLLRVAYERFGTLEAPPVAVDAVWQGRSASAVSDSGGFVDLSFPISGTAPLVTTKAELRLADAGAERPVLADVFGLHPQAVFGIISDIDDTVLETELTNPYRRALQLIYSEVRMRLPFEGIAALYQAFAQRNNPIFYVSNAPWNLYPHVVELLDHHEIPRGPLLLRDSRIAERLVRADPEGPLLVHKQRALRRIFEDFPKLCFVMLGDSSRRDALRYVEAAEAFPGRVVAIYIRRVRGVLARRDSLEHLKERARRVGVELLISDDTVTIAKHAESRGFVPPAEVGRVREAKATDEQSPPTELATVIAAPEEQP